MLPNKHGRYRLRALLLVEHPITQAIGNILELQQEML